MREYSVNFVILFTVFFEQLLANCYLLTSANRESPKSRKYNKRKKRKTTDPTVCFV